MYSSYKKGEYNNALHLFRIFYAIVFSGNRKEKRKANFCVVGERFVQKFWHVLGDEVKMGQHPRNGDGGPLADDVKLRFKNDGCECFKHASSPALGVCSVSAVSVCCPVF